MIFLCAWLSYRFVERPFIKLGHRLAPPTTEGRDDLTRAAPREKTDVTGPLAEVADKLN